MPTALSASPEPAPTALRQIMHNYFSTIKLLISFRSVNLYVSLYIPFALCIPGPFFEVD